MFDSFFKSQYIGGQKEKFVRLDDLDSTLSVPASTGGMKRVGFNLEGLPLPGRGKRNPSKSFRMGVKRGSSGLWTFGQSLRSGVTRAVFPEDLKVSEKKIIDPQDKSLMIWNKIFEVLCIFSVSFDPLFFYLPVINRKSNCLGIDNQLANAAVILRTIFDSFYLIRIGFKFRTAYIAPSSRVFGRGELVIDPAQIAKRYLMRYFIIDFLSVLPIPQIVVWKYFRKMKNSGVLETKTSLLRIVIFQYLPRFVRFIPLNSDVKKSAGVFSENAIVGAIYYLVWFLLASHITGSAWYLLAVERNDACWQKACHATNVCQVAFLYCDNKHKQNYDSWRNISTVVLNSSCNVDDENPKFNYGIYTQAISSSIVESREVFSKFCYCLWWGLQNLSTLGQGLLTSTYPGEVLFSIVIAIAGLVLFALLIGNMQTYLQSITVRLEEMRIKRRDSELWMHHRLLTTRVEGKSKTL
ncbi:putative Cyclic nucleotide-gated ion channel [Quillaja saponaria]|uniref:Cyclic nucleotide-gated ion channel n=1 Tax=Quillaja saponaria TaxID=32244 RepID=A0AAD7LQZ4_QUISA|nr:putative Cyclic nucleotide-gated ion channel [Quillaja saponaria]